MFVVFEIEGYSGEYYDDESEESADEVGVEPG